MVIITKTIDFDNLLIYPMFQSRIADDIKIKNKLKTKNIDSNKCI